MTHSLTLEIPDKTYRVLAEKASKNGKGIEEVAVERLSDDWPEDFSRKYPKYGDDPLDKLIGTSSSGIGDVGLNHDKYLGENLMREMRGENK